MTKLQTNLFDSGHGFAAARDGEQAWQACGDPGRVRFSIVLLLCAILCTSMCLLDALSCFLKHLLRTSNQINVRWLALTCSVFLTGFAGTSATWKN